MINDYVSGLGLEIINFNLIENAPDRVTVWVKDNSQGYANFVCLKVSPTMFLIWGYGTDYKEKLHTSFNYADVNTPNIQPMQNPHAYDY